MVVSLNSRLESNRDQEEGWGTHAEVVVLEELAGPPKHITLQSVYAWVRRTLLGRVDPSFRALSGRLKFIVRRHKFI